MLQRWARSRWYASALQCGSAAEGLVLQGCCTRESRQLHCCDAAAIAVIAVIVATERLRLMRLGLQGLRWLGAVLPCGC